MKKKHSTELSEATGTSDHQVIFCQLSECDTEEITALLNRTWPALYGDVGCPEYSEEYIRWLYGGPNRVANLLLGCRLNGVLVGFKGYLYRSVKCSGETLSAHITTHLTIDNSVPFGIRMSIASEFGMPHTLTGKFLESPVTKSDLLFAYFEDGKQLARSSEKIYLAAGITSQHVSFQHSIVNSVRLRAFVSASNTGPIRKCEYGDAHNLSQMLNSADCDELALQVTPEFIWHHISEAPKGCAFVSEKDGRAIGLVTCYVLATAKGTRRTNSLVVDFLLAEKIEILASLLSAVIDYADMCEARGVVIENTSYLSPDDCHDVGIISTPRRMQFVVRSRSAHIRLPSRFLCDVK